MKKLVLFAVCVCVLACGAVASAGYFTRPLPPNHHIHDCPDNHACGYPHLPVGFFPAILGESRAVYLLDPAECNDATDKALLPPNDQPRRRETTSRCGRAFATRQRCSSICARLTHGIQRRTDGRGRSRRSASATASLTPHTGS
jgi:hypothetical protein